MKYHCMIRKADGVSENEFRQYLKEKFAPVLSQDDRVVQPRLHLFDQVDHTRPPAPGVSHSEPPELHYQAAIEIAFWTYIKLCWVDPTDKLR